MSKKKESAHPNGPGVWMPKSTLDSPAWKALSHGAARLFIALKAKADNKHNTAYMSTRDAAAALGRKRGGGRKTREWFAELEHYGFIVKLSAGCLGTDGKGKAPHWRLADKGSVRGGFEPPKQEFLKWNGEVFAPEPYRHASRKWQDGKIPRTARERQGAADVSDSPVADVTTPNWATAADVSDIGAGAGASHVSDITSINHSPASPCLSSTTTSLGAKHGLPEFGVYPTLSSDEEAA